MPFVKLFFKISKYTSFKIDTILNKFYYQMIITLSELANIIFSQADTQIYLNLQLIKWYHKGRCNCEETYERKISSLRQELTKEAPYSKPWKDEKIS